MTRRLAAAAAIALLSLHAEAALIGRAPATPGGTDFQAFFDDVLDITWAADADLAVTSGYDVDGVMNWYEAQVWINSLNAGTGYLGVNAWRLPATIQPDPTCQSSFNGDGWGFGCTGSEMGHLANVDGISFGSPGPFVGIRSDYYWSSATGWVEPSDYAWAFDFYFGEQNFWWTSGPARAAWAVVDGDPLAAVPVPAAAWLFGGALGALGWTRRRQADARFF